MGGLFFNVGSKCRSIHQHGAQKLFPHDAAVIQGPETCCSSRYRPTSKLQHLALRFYFAVKCGHNFSTNTFTLSLSGAGDEPEP